MSVRHLLALSVLVAAASYTLATPPVIPCNPDSPCDPLTLTCTCTTVDGHGNTNPEDTCSCAPGVAEGEPHFKGYDGKRYDFQGTPDKNFAIISEPQLAINSLFTHMFGGNGNETVMRKTCVNYCGATLVLDGRSKTAVLAGQAVPLDGAGEIRGKHWTLVYNNETGAGSPPHTKVLKLKLGNRWNLMFRMVYDRVDLKYAWPTVDANVNMHGVLGHTWNLPAGHSPRCNPANEGGCEVTGVWEDYVVDELCSTAWKNSMYNGEGCPAM